MGGGWLPGRVLRRVGALLRAPGEAFLKNTETSDPKLCSRRAGTPEAEKLKLTCQARTSAICPNAQDIAVFANGSQMNACRPGRRTPPSPLLPSRPAVPRQGRECDGWQRDDMEDARAHAPRSRGHEIVCATNGPEGPAIKLCSAMTPPVK